MNRGARKLRAAHAARYLATDAQKLYLRRLLDEGFAHCWLSDAGVNLDRHHLERVSKAEASTAITNLLEAKARHKVAASVAKAPTEWCACGNITGAVRGSHGWLMCGNCKRGIGGGTFFAAQRAATGAEVVS